jgi:acyl-CoA thioesterase FadM
MSFLVDLGIDFTAMHRDRLDPVVSEAHIKYKAPLQSGDEFDVELKHEFQGKFRNVFFQRIVRKRDGQLILEAKITVAFLNQGRPDPADFFRLAIEKYKEAQG